MLEKLKQHIEEDNKSEIIKCIDEIWRDDELCEMCFKTLVDYFFKSEDKEILSHIDFCVSFALDSNNLLDKVKFIIENPKYSYSKISKYEHIHSAMFHNNEISSQLYCYFMLNNARKYLHEITELIKQTNIDLKLMELSSEEKIKCFYKTIGAVTPSIIKNMEICFNLLEDDELLNKDSDLLMIFARFYGWNYMGTSEKFIENSKVKSESQKELIEALKMYIEGVKQENFNRNLSLDFDIDADVLRAKLRVDREQQKEISENVNKKGLLSLFPITHILIGNKIVHVTEDGKGQIHCVETPMQKFSYESEIPFDCYFAPIDFEDTINFFLNGGSYEINN